MPSTSNVHTSGAVAARYSAKFSVVPDSSDRLTGVMSRSGSSASGLSSAMAGSFQLVISCAKIPAITSGRRFSVSTPSRLKATAIGDTYRGAWMTSPPQRSSAAVSSSSSNAASLPPNTEPPEMNCSRPPPDPIGS